MTTLPVPGRIHAKLAPVDVVVLILWALFLFVVLPLGIGFVVARQRVACGVWLLLAAAMAWAQSSDDELSGVWAVVAVLALAGLPLVLLGATLRSRRPRRS
jgi:hypothetical protein